MKRILISLAALMAAASPALAGDWIKAESQHFVVYSDTGEPATREFVNRLEGFSKIAEVFYSRLAQSRVDSENKMLFFYFADMKAYGVVEPALKGDGFKPSISCRDGQTSFWSNVKDISEQEIDLYQFRTVANDFYHRYGGQEMPKWLAWGLYNYLETADVQQDRIVVGKPLRDQFSYTLNGFRSNERVSIMSKQNRVPYSDIFEMTEPDQRKVRSFQGQSWVVVEYMLSDKANVQKLYAYADLYNSGLPSLEAWRQGTGIDPDTFDTVTHDYISKGVPMVTYAYAPLSPDSLSIDQLPPWDDGLPMLSAAVRTCPEPERRTELLGQLVQLAEAHSDDAFAQREMARGQVLLGDPQAAIPYLEKEVAAHASDFDARYLLGRAWLNRAESSSGEAAKAAYVHARAELGKAYLLNTTDAPTLYDFARAHADQADYPNDNTLVAAESAYDLVGDTDYEFYLGELYARRGMYDDVKDLLPLAEDKDTSNYAVVTRSIHAAIAAGKKPSEVAVLFKDYSGHPWQKATKKSS